MELSRRALLKIPRRPNPAAAAPDQSDQSGNDGFWLHLGRPAMACRFEVTLPSELGEHLDAAHAALDGVDRLEDQLSIFRDTSELSFINREAAATAVPVEERLFALLAQCQALHAETGGAFDITSTPLSKVWGFLRRQGRLPTGEELAEALARVGMQHVVLDPAARTVRFTREGMALNLGSIGKGYALDRVGAAMAATGVKTALLTAGASSVLAVGEGIDGTGFVVGLRDPFDHEQRMGTVQLRNAALGVSGTGEQHFTVDDKRYGHILDARTGWPVVDRAYVAVVAPTAALADAVATACFVGGRETAEAYVKSHREVSVLMMDTPPNGESKAPAPVLIGSPKPWSLPHAV
jgi:thiamine biosynthesis lipoprotein